MRGLLSAVRSRIASWDPALDRRADDLLGRLGTPGGLPAWPSEALQRRYTGAHGRALMRRTIAFVDLLERNGAFAAADWRGLDYGCGWGRIATVMLTRGGPEQLDLCDAWPATIALLAEAGFANRVLKASEAVRAGELPEGAYDFVYAFSVFTHLRRDAFENNLARLLSALKPGGKLFVTVRHDDHLALRRLNVQERDRETLDRDGFWFKPQASGAIYGTTVVRRRYLQELPGIGSLTYLGRVDGQQHLYLLGA